MRATRPSRRAIASIALLLACAQALSGCTSEPETERAEAALRGSYADFAAADAQAFCRRLSPDFRPDFERTYGPCNRATIERQLEQLSESELAMVREPDVSTVKIYGSEANATVNFEYARVVEVDGEWLLAIFPLPPPDRSL